jgi:hypothetical protein
VPASLVALPWYVKNAVLTGNPVYPFLFGGANPEADASARAQLHDYGFGRGPLDLVLLPARLLVDAEPFDRGEFITPLFVLFAPLALLERRARAATVAILAACAVYLLGWFLGSQHARFLIPLMPYGAVLAAVGILAFARLGQAARRLTVGVVLGALAVACGVSLVYTRGFFPVVLGRESSTQFLREKTSYYTGTEWLDRHLPADAHVALGHIFALYLDRPYVVWTSDVLPSTAGPAATRAFVRRWKLDYAAVLASNRGTRARQLRDLHARLIARVPVRPVVSRTQNELGPPDVLLVYAIPHS